MLIRVELLLARAISSSSRRWSTSYRPEPVMLSERMNSSSGRYCNARLSAGTGLVGRAHEYEIMQAFVEGGLDLDWPVVDVLGQELVIAGAIVFGRTALVFEIGEADEKEPIFPCGFQLAREDERCWLAYVYDGPAHLWSGAQLAVHQDCSGCRGWV